MEIKCKTWVGAWRKTCWCWTRSMTGRISFHSYIFISQLDAWFYFKIFAKKISIHEWRDIWQNLTKIWCKNIALEQAGVVNLFVKNKKLCRKANRKYLLLKISLNIWVKVLLFSQKLGVGERRSEVMQSYGLFGTCMQR